MEKLFNTICPLASIFGFWLLYTMLLRHRLKHNSFRLILGKDEIRSLYRWLTAVSVGMGAVYVVAELFIHWTEDSRSLIVISASFTVLGIVLTIFVFRVMVAGAISRAER